MRKLWVDFALTLWFCWLAIDFAFYNMDITKLALAPFSWVHGFHYLVSGLRGFCGYHLLGRSVRSLPSDAAWSRQFPSPLVAIGYSLGPTPMSAHQLRYPTQRDNTATNCCCCWCCCCQIKGICRHSMHRCTSSHVRLRLILTIIMSSETSNQSINQSSYQSTKHLHSAMCHEQIRSK